MFFQRQYLRFLSKIVVFYSFFVFIGTIAASSAVLDKVIVVVNEEVVTQRDFDKLYIPFKKEYEADFEGEELKNRLEETKKNVFDQLVNVKLTISLAKKGKITIDEEKFKERIEKIKSFYDSEGAFLQALKDKGTNLSEFNEEVREQMLAQKLIEREVTSKITVSPVELEELYDKNKEKFQSPRKVKVRSIMVRKGNDTLNAESRKKIEEIKSRLDSGEDFAALAVEKSEGPYADKGGDMGYIMPGQVIEEIEKVVFSLEKDRYSDIVETQVWFHIFKVEDVQESYMLQFKEVSDFLSEQMFMKKFQEEITKWFEEKKKDAYISYK